MATKNARVDVVADERIAQINGGTLPPPTSWGSRALYLGKTGSRNWLAVLAESTYPLRDPDTFGLRRNRLAALAGRSAATVVSLGPGDGMPDIDLVTSLQRPSGPPIAGQGARRPTYIPVDISRPLLEKAIASLRPYADASVAILCDFEEDQDFLADALGRYATRPILFALLGGTLGNLDRGEAPFVEGVRRMMQPGDAFLLDVPLAAPGWSAADEPRLKAEAYTRAFRRFLGGSLDPFGRASGTEPRDADPGSAFDERFGFTLGHDASTGAEVITVTERRQKRSVLTFRRYRWQPLLYWLEDHGFSVQLARSSVTSDQDKFGMGVILLTAR